MDELKERLREIWEELDEHLDALNQNTSEVTSLYDHLNELDLKIDKLSERVDALQALILAQTRDKPPTRNVRLTAKEESIVRVLVESAQPLTSAEIGKHIGLTSDLAAQALYCLKQKGIPVRAHTVGEQTIYVLDEAFKLQHKQREDLML